MHHRVLVLLFLHSPVIMAWCFSIVLRSMQHRAVSLSGIYELQHTTHVLQLLRLLHSAHFVKNAQSGRRPSPFLCIRTKTKNKSPLSHVHTPTRAVHALEDYTADPGLFFMWLNKITKERWPDTLTLTL